MASKKIIIADLTDTRNTPVSPINWKICMLCQEDEPSFTLQNPTNAKKG